VSKNEALFAPAIVQAMMNVVIGGRDQKRQSIFRFTERTTNAIDRLRSHRSAHDQLCSICISKNISALFTWQRNNAEWDFSQVVAQKNCSFCRLIANVVFTDHGDVEARKFIQQRATVRLDRCSLWEYKFRGSVIGRRAKLLRSDSDSSSIGDAIQHEFCVHSDPEDGSCILTIGQGTPTYGLLPRTAMGELNLRLVQKWIHTCSETHGHCWQPSEPSGVPQMVIDVRSERVIKTPKSPSFRYLCLSYVWGTVDQPRLTKKTFKNLSKSGSLNRIALPQTIRDAITLTREMGEKYLWVDCLCIFQDDEENLQEQIEKMHLVFRQAYLTIIAAVGNNSNSGLPGVRGSTAKREPHHIVTIGSMQLSMVPIKPHGELRKSVWNGRGWTFQEELCASRRLVFTKSIVTFSCAEATWREDFPERLTVNQVERYAYPLYPAFGPFYAQSEGEKEDVLKWYCIVLQNYLSRSLTSSDDILKAFAGVSSFLSDVLGPAFWGLSENYFHQAICWHCTTDQVPLRRREGFPSWSWAGWFHPNYDPQQPVLKFVPRENGLIPIPLIQFFSPSRPQRPWPSRLDDVHEHFIPDLGKILEAFANISVPRSANNTLLCFFTSSAILWVERMKRRGARQMNGSYAVRRYEGGELLATMWATESDVSQGSHQFIVTGCIPSRSSLFDQLNIAEAETEEPEAQHDEEAELESESRMQESFCIMMIGAKGGISYRKGVATYVPASRWWSVGAERSLVILG
jgi:Heterokaryon incompatibility protein (HET)